MGFLSVAAWSVKFKYYLVLLNITMESISLKMEAHFLQEIEKAMKKHNYSTKTEFIREAIRDKMKELKEVEKEARFRPEKTETRKAEPRPIPSYI